MESVLRIVLSRRYAVTQTRVNRPPRRGLRLLQTNNYHTAVYVLITWRHAVAPEKRAIMKVQPDLTPVYRSEK